MVLRRRRRLIAAVLLGLLVASSSLGVLANLNAGRAPSVPDTEPYDLVTPVGAIRGEQVVPIDAARLNSRGDLQIVVEGSSCAVLTSLAGAVGTSQVDLVALAWFEQDCRPVTVPWLVQVPLEEPWGERTLLVGLARTQLGVVDCRAMRAADLCRLGESGTQ